MPHRSLCLKNRQDTGICFVVGLSRTEACLLCRFLVESAAKEGRIVLTCDRNFMKRRLTNQAFFVQGKNKKAQLTEVIAAFNLTISDSKLLSRCAKCNGKFIGRCAARS